MSLNEAQNETFHRFNQEGFRQHIDSCCTNALKHFKKIIQSYVFFHLFFCALIICELTAFFVFLTFLSKTSYLAFSLAGIIVSIFAYLTLIFYFQTKKPEQFLELRTWFMMLCKQALPKSLSHSDHHLSLAHAAYRLASCLGKQEYFSGWFPKHARTLNLLAKKLSFACHFKDIHRMKEILLLVSINEHIQLIKQKPTDLEAHASLAHAYVALSRLYSFSHEFHFSHHSQWVPKGHLFEEMQHKFAAAAKKAIQEFKIMDTYAPNDPWVHAQLASCYHDLEMYPEEIEEYETVLSLCPNDKEIMFRLGILYFQQGQNAKGLQLYEQLKKLNFSQANDLIDFYDANLKNEYYIDAL